MNGSKVLDSVVGASEACLEPGRRWVGEGRRDYDAPSVMWVEPLHRCILAGPSGAGDSGAQFTQEPGGNRPMDESAPMASPDQGPIPDPEPPPSFGPPQSWDESSTQE